jgi:predicted membrane-bound spermidine synthase
MRNKLLILALLEGGLVMLLETASPIVVAPVLGHSVMIWAMMLSLSVGSLAVGYFLGAWLAKKERDYTFLMKLFLLNALIIFLGWILMYAQNFWSDALVTSTFSMVVILFLLIIPLILFGSSTPVVIAILNKMPEGDSSLAGSVFSISTVGGILFSLLTGYYLIDALGVSDTILFGLFLTAILPVLYFLKAKQWIATGLSGGIALMALILMISEKPLMGSDEFQIKHFSEGITGQLIVADFMENNEMNRVLLINRMGQTKLNLKTNYSSWPYVNYLTSAASIYPQGSKTLLLGLGGGLVSGQINHYLGHSVDAVELDDRIIELSDEYFDNLNASVNKISDDARRFVKSTTEKYDFIALDIFNGEIMPSHGLSKEAFEDIALILRPGGLIVINFNGFISGKEGIAGRSLLKTLHEAGFKVDLFDCEMGKQKESDRNLLYFAYKDTPQWNKATVNTMIDGAPYKIGENLMDLKKIDLQNAELITDDRPVMEYLNRYAASAWRKAYLEVYTKKFRKDMGLPLVR